MLRRCAIIAAGPLVLAILSSWPAAPATAAEASGMSASVTGAGIVSTPDRSTATVPVTVQCDALADQASGNIDVMLVQTLGSKSTQGTGSTNVVCDGAPHNYEVVVPTTDDARWREAEATVSLSGEAEGYGEPQQVCIEGPDENGEIIVECHEWTPHMIVHMASDPAPIELVTEP